MWSFWWRNAPHVDSSKGDSFVVCRQSVHPRNRTLKTFRYLKRKKIVSNLSGHLSEDIPNMGRDWGVGREISDYTCQSFRIPLISSVALVRQTLYVCDRMHHQISQTHSYVFSKINGLSFEAVVENDLGSEMNEEAYETNSFLMSCYFKLWCVLSDSEFGPEVQTVNNVYLRTTLNDGTNYKHFL